MVTVSVEPFKSLTNRYRAVFTIFGILAAESIGVYWLGYLGVRGVAETTGDWALEAAYMSIVLFSCGFVLFVTNAIAGHVFLGWLHRASKNVVPLGGNLRFSPNWAVGSFFVPLLNLVRPYQVVREILKESDPGTETVEGLSRRYSPATMVGWWWALFLTTLFGNVWWWVAILITLFFLWTDGTIAPSSALGVSYATVGVEILNLAGMAVTVLMVRKVNAFQQRKYELIWLEGGPISSWG